MTSQWRDDLTYPDVGATESGVLPRGYRALRGRARMGTGRQVYRAAVRALSSFDMQRAAGLKVRTEAGQAEPGAAVSFGAGIGPLRLWAPCRVVWVTEQADRYGYGYGTVAGHPESGEEGFWLEIDEREEVWLTITAYTRPARWFVRLGGPFAQLVQDYAAARYRTALRRLATHG